MVDHPDRDVRHVDVGRVAGEPATVGSWSGEATEPFPRSGLAALLFTAAMDAPGAILVGDDEAELSAAEVAARVRRTATQLSAAGLSAGERVLIVAGAQAAAVVALAAALACGLEPALAPVGLGPVEIAAHARAAGASALVGPSHYGGLALGEAYLSAAAVVDTIRLIATQGPEPVDGAIDVSAAALAAAAGSDSPMAGGRVVGLTPDGATPDGLAHEGPVVVTFQGSPGAPTVMLHRQASLFADALSLVEQARINPSKRIVSTLPPATLAGLVSGPFAALVGAASLRLHGPFDAAGFLAACDAASGFHLVAPCEMGPPLEQRSLTEGMTSLILVSRFADLHAFALPAPLTCDRPMVDLYAFGEDTLLARRRTDGEARPPARVSDKSTGGGLGARLNRARADAWHSDERS